MTGHFGLDMALVIHEKVTGLRWPGSGRPQQQLVSFTNNAGRNQSTLHGQTMTPGASPYIVQPDAISQLASQKDITGHSHMVQILYPTAPPPGTVPRASRFRHGIRMNSQNRWEVILDPDQSVQPFSTERTLQHQHWWDSIHIPTNASDLGISLLSIVQAGVDAGSEVGRMFFHSIRDVNHHLTMGWDNTVGGLTKWVHILWRAVVIGTIVLGLYMTAPVWRILSDILYFLWQAITEIVGVVGEVADWFASWVEALVDGIFSGAQ